MFIEAKNQLQTIRDVLRFAISRFNDAGLHFGHGSASAYDEAAYLILHTLHLPLYEEHKVSRLANSGRLTQITPIACTKPAKRIGAKGGIDKISLGNSL